MRVYVMVKLSVPACARAELFSENNICIIVLASYITNVSSYRLTISVDCGLFARAGE